MPEHSGPGGRRAPPARTRQLTRQAAKEREFSLPGGRHVAIRSDRFRARLRAQRHRTAIGRFRWIIILGVCSAVAGVGLTFGLGGTKTALLSRARASPAPRAAALGSSVLSRAEHPQGAPGRPVPEPRRLTHARAAIPIPAPSP